MFKFIHAADIHLDSPLRRLEQYEGAPVEAIREATRRALVRLVDLALAEQVQLLLIAGDVYDGDWNDYETGLFFNKQMVRLRDGGIPVVIISGNHDAANVMTRTLQLPDTVRTLAAEQAETFELTESRVAVHGQSFADRAVLQNLSVQYPAARTGWFNIGLLHTCATGDDGHEPYAPCTVADLLNKHYQYWALGHVHDRRCLNESPPIYFSGNLQGRHPKETGAKGCLLVTVDDNQSVAVDFRAVDVFRWEVLSLDASGLDDEQALREAFRAGLIELRERHEGLPLAVRVELSGKTPLHGVLHTDGLRWQNQLRADAAGVAENIWLEQIKLRIEPPPHAIDELPEDGPIGELRECLAALREDEAALAELAEELASLHRQLPAELAAEEQHGWDSPAVIRNLLGDVEPLLLSRLQAEGASA